MQGVMTTEQMLEKLPGAFQAAAKKINADKREQEWLKKRMGRITGSEVYRLFTKKLAIANNETSKMLINQKVAELFGARMPQKYSKAIQWGNEHEVEAVLAYMKKTGAVVTDYGEDQKFIEYGEYGGCTNDGIVEPLGIIEVKCPYVPANHINYMLNENQEQFKANHVNHYCQVQNNMLVTGKKWCDFISYHPEFNDDQKLFILRIERDAAFIADLVQALEDSSQKINEYFSKLR